MLMFLENAIVTGVCFMVCNGMKSTFPTNQIEILLGIQVLDCIIDECCKPLL